MPTRNVNLTKRFDDLIERNVSSGRYGNASEVVREGLRLLEKQEKEEAAWNEYVCRAAQEGVEAIERGDYIVLESNEDIERLLNETFDEALRANDAERRKSARKSA